MNYYKPEGALISTQKNYDYISTPEGLKKALERQIILESHAILCDQNLNLQVYLPAGIKGIIPKEEVAISNGDTTIKDIAILTRVGKTVCFKILGFKTNDNGETVALLSRKAAQYECIENYVKSLIPGDVIQSKVTHLEKFGAFIDIGCGIISLLSIDTISVSRITHPSERLRVGDNIFTVVKSVDERGRVYLSSRELLGTWEENVSLFKEGQTVRGIIRSIENYGVFVELKPNLAGLAEYRDDVFEGQSAAVYIKSIIPDKMKIKLIIIDTETAPLDIEPLSYFVDVGEISHIDSWQYSPKSARKVIETVF